MSPSMKVILLADDEELARQVLTTVLRRGGYQLLIASDGDEALDLSRRYAGEIDLLVSDIYMPHMNGVELAKTLVKERPGVRVLLVSGQSVVDVPPDMPFLAKPFTAQKLQHVVEQVLDSPPPAGS